ncbi:MAG: class I SAM-dependent methyltransferase [Alphaproteobacteria bacterium]|nr:class I SAM-dependent methyltransferase [Alphaproteobacteria bacterium]
MTGSHRINRCRSCGATALHPILDLGLLPLANALPTAADADEPRFPLELVLCPGCGLVQITETVPPEVLFADYLYRSSFSEAFVRHVQSLAERLMRQRPLGSDALVLEVASNDGYLLQHYKAAGVPVLGIEPAANIAAFAEQERGIPTVVDFFGPDLAVRLAGEGRQADVIHAHNVLAHMPDPNAFAAGVRMLLKPDGIAIVEAPYVKDLIDKIEFDTIYHEHFSYFSLTAVDALMRRHGLVVCDVEHVPVHGGTLRYTIARQGSPVGEAVPRLAAEEAEWGVKDPDFYRGFSDRVSALQRDLTGLLSRLKTEGASIAAYGAAAKGSTLLNAFGIGAETLDFIADRSTLKQGRFMSGVGVPIVADDVLLDRRPDYVLLLAWNFADEILTQQSAYRDEGGKFIIPVPEVRIA